MAVNLPPATREALHDALTPLRVRAPSVRWLAADALHVTLQFLGGIDDTRVPVIADGLADAARRVAAFDLHIGGWGGFPTLRRARLWWVGVAADPLKQLHAAVTDRLVGLGFEPDTRAFHPHVTVARAPRDVRRSEVNALGDADVAWRAEVQVSTLELMQSHLGHAGARHEVVASLPLGR